MKAYTFLQDNKVMVSSLPKPEIYPEWPGTAYNIKKAEILREWQSSILGEVENVKYSGVFKTWVIIQIIYTNE